MPVALKGSTSGEVTLAAPAVAGSNTITLPAATGTALVATSQGTSGQILVSAGTGAASTWQTNGWTFVSKTTASSSATIDVTDLSAYSAIRITINSLRPATDDSNLQLRFSSDNGVTYIATTTYKFANTGISSGTVSKSSASTGDDHLRLTIGDGIGNQTADGGYSGTLVLSSFNQAIPTFASGTCSYGTQTSVANVGTVGGFQTGSTAMNAFRLFMGSGNIASGSIVVEGMV